MKKLLLIPALLGTIAFATDYNYEITPLIGYNVAEGNLNLENKVMTGLEMQFNDVDAAIKPEISLLHSGGVNSEKTLPTNTTNVTRLGLNGVYEFGASESVVPFAKAGIGYEHMNRDIANNSDGAYVDAGAGVKIPFTEALALKLEALYMLKYNNNSAGGNWGDSNLALLAGLSYSFGAKAQPVAPAPVDGDDDNDGVLNSMDKCPTTAAGKSVNAEGCFIDGDDDMDTVLNAMDKCPNSPAASAVNAEGCPIVINLHINFENDSFEVDAASDTNIQDFADFLNKYPAYNAKIVGHTDSRGPASYNLGLSANRANAVKNLIVDKGVSADRLQAIGLGEDSAIADNQTKEGRAQNRRIEAELLIK
ncbi:MAG: OmpA family protein [Sulfurimonas sp.]|nr:OmpA family protein [Sulfurimonas sp.]